MNYTQPTFYPKPVAQKQPGNFLHKISSLYTLIGGIFILGGFLFLITPAFPYVYYNLNPEATQDELDTLDSFTVSAQTPTTTPIVTPTPTPQSNLPPIDPSLSKTNMLVIPKIGVNGPINEGLDSKRALYRGVWRTPGWGTPDDFSKPTILAAHRFGYIEWTEEFRKTNSFKNLPELEVGDTFYVIWQQRKFNYVIKRKEEINLIDTANTDMILYTCKYLKSSIRIVLFADRAPN